MVTQGPGDSARVVALTEADYIQTITASMDFKRHGYRDRRLDVTPVVDKNRQVAFRWDVKVEATATEGVSVGLCLLK